ncbi:MAG: hypothetical protein LC648_03810, partial [Novosphingobium sp.]|nr:hypothetical protein [Novosphingobium sp.]
MRFSSMGPGNMGRGRRLLSAALATGVAIGALGMAATPAFAQKKGKEAAAPQGPKISISKAFQPAAAAAQAAVNAAKTDPAQVPAAKAAVDAAFAAATTPDDKFVAGQLAVSLGSSAKDTALTRRGLQAMVATNKTPADNGKYNFFIASLAYDAKDYAAAQAAARAAIQSGYTTDEVQILLAETYVSQNQPAQGLAELKKAVAAKRAAGQAVPEAWLKRAVTVAYRAKLTNEAAEWALTQVELYPNSFNWLGSTQIVRLVGNYGPNETVDLFRLMMRSGAFDNDPKLLGNEFKEYVEAADPRRLPGEVVTVIDKGTASGALARSQWVTDMRALASGRIAADKASLPAAPAAASNGLTLLSTGDAWLNYNDAAKAEAFFKAALGKPGVDKDRVLTRLGIAQFDQG